MLQDGEAELTEGEYEHHTLQEDLVRWLALDQSCVALLRAACSSTGSRPQLGSTLETVCLPVAVVQWRACWVHCRMLAMTRPC